MKSVAYRKAFIKDMRLRVQFKLVCGKTPSLPHKGTKQGISLATSEKRDSWSPKLALD